MTTINLRQVSPGEQEKKSSRNGGFIFSISILVAVLLLLVVLKIWGANLAGKSRAMLDDVNAQTAQFAGNDNVEQVMDIQTRIGLIRQNLKNNPEATANLDHLSSAMVSGVVVSSYKDDGQNIDVAFTSGNFEDASRQVLSLKESQFFTGVNVIKTAKTLSSVNFEVGMSAKK